MKQLIFTTYILLIGIITFNTGLSSPINPYINSVSPPMNSNIVLKSSDIVITFMQDMNGSLMTDENIKLFGYQTGLMTASLDYNSVTKTLTINPVNNFKNGEKISLTLTSGLKTIANESITPFVYSFRTKALGGTGFFTKSSGIINNNQFTYILSGDVDNDGDIDLLFNDKIFKNNGNALFTYYSSLSISGYPIMADFDSDGDLDIQVALNNNTYLFQNNGVGDFTQTTSYAGLNGSIGDFDGNGYFDMAYFSQQTGLDILVVKNSQGISSIDTVYHVSTNCFNPQYNYYDRIIINDMNNDGSLDFIGINGTGFGDSIEGYSLCRSFHKFTNDGSGKFFSQFFYSQQLNNYSPPILWIGDTKTFDYDNDGFNDIISPGLNLKNDGSGLFLDQGYFIPFHNSADFDFNGDGFIDLITISSFSSTVIVNSNNGNGTFSQSYLSNNYSFRSSASGDFDNDGDIDIAIKEYYTNEVAILLNGDSPLPVELSSFSSSVNSNSVKLNWSTSSEQNNSGFEIQRTSLKNESPYAWTKIGFAEGQGNSNSSANYNFEDKNLLSGKYKYRLKQIDFNGNFKYYDLSNEVVIGIPTSTEFMQNHPNPFNPVTNISYRLSENGFVTLKVFDNSGRELKTLVNEFKEAGYYTIEFNGSNLASGIYFYKLTAGDFVQTKKLSLVK
ncbi:MAG: VCBS repeat-containing protein [Bacteroidetes bacterium]|nr:VCBS repeat-containing protein [Bacteroidota bacterium]